MAIVRTDVYGKMSVETFYPGEIFEVIEKLEWVPKNAKASNSPGKGAGFYTFDSLAEAVDIYRNTPEKVVAYDPNDKPLENYENLGNEVVYDVTGDYVDVDRYLEDLPDNMGNSIMGNPRNVFATINFLLHTVSYISTDVRIARQRRIIRLVDWLESQQIRTQVVTTCDSGFLYESYMVKTHHEPLDINQVAVAAHPDFARRVSFLVSEQAPNWEYGYGRADAYDKKMFNYKPEPGDGLYIYVGGYFEDDIKRVNREFDEVEKNIQKFIDEGRTWNDELFTVGKESARVGW